MRLIWMILAILSLINGEDSWRVLRPCFERYLQTKLANVVPFHSEGRMPTEDHCLRFCAETASRCRSIVYEPLRHVCHFFLDEGSEMAVPAQHMSYFRVTTQECLDHVSAVLGPMDIEGEKVEYSPLEENQDQTSPSTTTTSTTISTEETSAFQRVIETPDYEGMNEESEPSTEPMNSSTIGEMETTLQDEVNQQQDQQMSKELSDISEMITEITKKSEEKSSSMDTEEIEEELREKMHQLRELFPEKFDQLVGDSKEKVDESMESSKSVESKKSSMISDEEEPMIKEKSFEKEELNEGTAQLNEQNQPHRSRFFKQAKVLKISKERLEPGFGKLKKRKPNMEDEIEIREPFNYEGLRRSPQKSTHYQKSGFVDKAKDFLNEIGGDDRGEESDMDSKEKEEEDEWISKPKQSLDLPSIDDPHLNQPKTVIGIEKLLFKRTQKVIPACDEGEAPLWMIWEGTEQNLPPTSSREDHSRRLQSNRDCQRLCNSLTDCVGYTYHEKSGTCEASSQFDGVSLIPSHSSDTTTSTKFCFTNALSVFNQCPPMKGFTGYSLEVKPREEFDGLPHGYDGFKMCIELCVLTTQYQCQSGSFLLDEGRCLLNEEDSSSTPASFQPSFLPQHLYFENSCSHTTHITQQEEKHQSVIRVTPMPRSSQEKRLFKFNMKSAEASLPKAKKLRLVRIQPLKPSSSKPEMDGTINDVIGYTGAFLKRFFRF